MNSVLIIILIAIIGLYGLYILVIKKCNCSTKEPFTCGLSSTGNNAGIPQVLKTVAKSANPSSPSSKMITFFPYSRGWSQITVPVSSKANCIDWLKIFNPTIEEKFEYYRRNICDANFPPDPRFDDPTFSL